MVTTSLIEKELKRRELVTQRRRATVKKVQTGFLRGLERASMFSQRVEKTLRREKKPRTSIFGSPLSSVVLSGGMGIRPVFPKKKPRFIIVRRRRKRR